MDRIICEICGNRPTECTHHLIFGWGMRELSDEDKLTIEICNHCHNTGGSDSIHGNTSAEKLSKMLGQALWETDAMLRGMQILGIDDEQIEWMKNEARTAFRERYGRSFL